MAKTIYDMILEARTFIESKTKIRPEYGIILGTGLGKLVDSIEKDTVIPYETIPHFPVSTVETHAGKLILGTLAEKARDGHAGQIPFLRGIFHAADRFPGARDEIPRRAYAHRIERRGGVNPLFPPGSVMLITDHINLLFTNPLIGTNDKRIGPMYPDMSEPYSKRLVELCARVALENRIPIVKGVYAAMTGPCLETRAEYRMLKLIGADAIGMSTVPEVIAAVHAGLKVLGLSVITDSCLPDALEPVDIKKIIATANDAEPQLVALIEKVLQAL